MISIDTKHILGDLMGVQTIGGKVNSINRMLGDIFRLATQLPGAQQASLYYDETSGRLVLKSFARTPTPARDILPNVEAASPEGYVITEKQMLSPRAIIPDGYQNNAQRFDIALGTASSFDVFLDAMIAHLNAKQDSLLERSRTIGASSNSNSWRR